MKKKMILALTVMCSISHATQVQFAQDTELDPTFNNICRRNAISSLTNLADSLMATADSSLENEKIKTVYTAEYVEINKSKQACDERLKALGFPQDSY